MSQRVRRNFKLSSHCRRPRPTVPPILASELIWQNLMPVLAKSCSSTGGRKKCVMRKSRSIRRKSNADDKSLRRSGPCTTTSSK